jgi:hypothetical protein
VNNHYSSYAVGAIVLLVDGFEAWLNQSIWYLARKSSDDPLFKLADKPIMSKYRGVPKQVCGSEMLDNRSLEMLVELRNEIAHFLPRIIQEDRGKLRHVPRHFEELFEKRIFFVGPEENLPEDTELLLSDLMSSYRLAYWAWETVAEAVEIYREALKEDPAATMLHSQNFHLYNDVCPPDSLPQYDSQHGISIP